MQDTKQSANPTAPEPLQANFETLGGQEESQSQFDQQISQSEPSLTEISRVGELGRTEGVTLASLEDELLQESRAEPEMVEGRGKSLNSGNNSRMNSGMNSPMNSARLSQRLDEELMQQKSAGASLPTSRPDEREDDREDLLEEHYGSDGEMSGDQGQ